MAFATDTTNSARVAAGATKPKAAKFYTYKNQVTLAPGEQLHFQPGRGYFAGPKIGTVASPAPGGVRAPAPPVSPFAPLSAADIATQADAYAKAQIDPQTAEIQHQADLAAAREKAISDARSGFGLAAMELLKGIDYQAPYSGAAGDIGGLAKGFSEAAAQRLAGVEAQNEDFARSQGQDYTSEAKPSALQGTLYDLNGYIPGSNLAEQGAHAAEWGNAQPGIQMAATNADLDALHAKAIAEQDDYAQQIINVAKQFPQLRQQALQQLQQYEIDKATYRLNVKNSAADNARQARALRDNEIAAGIKNQQTQQEFKYKWASLKLQTQKAQQAVQRASNAGRQIDAAGSKVRGFVVDKNGDFVLDENGNRIPVAKSASTSGQTLTAYQRAQLTKQANETAQTLKGDPVAVPSGQAKYTPGKYLAAPGAKGKDVYPAKGKGPLATPATTNNPAKAQRDGSMTFAQAQASLMSTYNITKARARAILVANGWKPDGKRG